MEIFGDPSDGASNCIIMRSGTTFAPSIRVFASSKILLNTSLAYGSVLSCTRIISCSSASLISMDSRKKAISVSVSLNPSRLLNVDTASKFDGARETGSPLEVLIHFRSSPIFFLAGNNPEPRYAILLLATSVFTSAIAFALYTSLMFILYYLLFKYD